MYPFFTQFKGLAAEVYQQKLAEGQEIAEAVLDAEVRLGELRKSIQKDKGGRLKKTTDTDVRSFDTPLKQFDDSTGLSERDNRRLESMASHPDIVQQVKQPIKQTRAYGRYKTSLRAATLSRPCASTWCDSWRGILRREHGKTVLII